MTDVKRLLEQATPLPWAVGEQLDKPYGTGRVGRKDEYADTAIVNLDGKLVVSAYNFHCCQFPMDITAEESDLDLIIHAVNRLPDYEAAVDALEALVDFIEPIYNDEESLHDLTDAGRAALLRLREEIT